MKNLAGLKGLGLDSERVRRKGWGARCGDLIMAVALPGQLNLDETPSWGSRSVDCFEKIEQIGEGTYGYGYYPLPMCRPNSYFQFFSFIPLFGWPEDEILYCGQKMFALHWKGNLRGVVVHRLSLLTD